MNLLKRMILGRTDIEVSELCLGTLTMSRIQADLSPTAMIPVFQKALELGIVFYDTAHRYLTYEHLRMGLGRDIGKVVIASKTDARELSEAKAQVEECFRTIGRDMIDIYLLHQVDGEAEFQVRRPVLDYLLDLKARRKVRAVGISSHRIGGNLAAINHADELDVLFPIINMRGLGIVDGRLEECLASVRKAQSVGLGVYAMKPIGGGHLRHDVPAAIRWLRSQEVVDAVCVGMKSVDEVEVNVGIFSDGNMPVDPEKARRIISQDRRAIVNFMCRRCGACAEFCDQKAITMDDKKAKIDPDKCILCGYCAPKCPQFAIRVI